MPIERGLRVPRLSLLASGGSVAVYQPEPAVRKADLINSIEARIPFRVAQRMLRGCSFPTSNSWPATKEKISNNVKKLNYHGLNELYLQSLVAAEKSVSAFRVDSDIRAALLTAIETLEPDKNSLFAKKYPYVLDVKTLEKTEAAGTIFVGKEVLPYGMAVMFSTVRITENRERLPAAKMPITFQKQFAEFFGVRRSFHQSYDAVIVPSTGEFVWVSVDAPVGSNNEYAEFAHLSVRNAFNELVSANPLQKPENLFPLVSKLYQATTEGSVLSLSHLVSTASVKHEKMRNGNCLREELFHKAGATAVKGQIAAFAIGVSWDAPTGDSQIEIHIEGEAKDASKAAPLVDRAVVRKALKPDELSFALGKILEYL